jgi:hypothetical protein
MENAEAEAALPINAKVIVSGWSSEKYCKVDKYRKNISMKHLKSLNVF